MPQRMKKFVFLYPLQDIFDYLMHCRSGNYARDYRKKLNQAIDIRYRQNEFEIVYALFNDTAMADMIRHRKGDRIIRVGMNVKEHRTKRPDGTYPYPSQNYILSQIGMSSELVISGFHRQDCVERLAKEAHSQGRKVLVDEDLTETLDILIRRPDFRVDRYPGCDYSTTMHPDLVKMFLEHRKNKPWLLKYPLKQ